MFYLLQTDTAQNIAGAAVATAEKVSLWTLLDKGGWIMYPLYLLLILAIYVFTERLLAIRRAGLIDPQFMVIIRDHILSGNVQAAKTYARSHQNPVAKMIDKGLQRIGKPIDAIEKSMENVGKLEMYNMEKNLNILSLIAGIAPMFGFLGTIIGMVQLFYGIASTGEYTLNTIAGGIYTKMITSATGLIIGLIAYVGHNFLSTQIDKTANKMEAASADFMDILQEPTR
ncbi:MotA/TolQ/ExbB proton channel family protein [Sediminibacterium sp. C3]|uniref:MotA/TolQ/ExbB proton channel family protein n=1 Tax=Sediminibacterium sp. C3 TaxID=1267211 RepID=UPI0003FB8216|nr:MotA/TolQ/ExbB proton channel family protein [Sediminibacterium sp. C3]